MHSVQTTLNQALGHLNTGAPAEALALIEAHTNHQNSSSLQAIRGEALYHLGKEEEGCLILEHVLQRSRSCEVAVAVYAAIANTKVRRTKARALTSRLLKKKKLHAATRRQLLFKRGRLNDALGDYAAAYRDFVIANRTVQTTVFDSESHHSAITALIKRFSGKAWNATPTSENQSRAPIFILGPPRSGTSLCERLLSSHPQVRACGEVYDIGKIHAFLYQRFGDDWSGAPQNLLQQLSHEYLAARASEHEQADDIEGIHYIDKMPSNIMNIGVIEKIFPQATIIYCSRHPLDICLSALMQDFQTGHAFTAQVETMAHYILDCERMLSHWRSNSSMRIHRLEYEDLVRKPRQEIENLVAALGLAWADECLDCIIGETRGYTHTASFDQVRKPIYQGAVGRYLRYTKELRGAADILGIDLHHKPSLQA